MIHVSEKKRKTLLIFSSVCILLLFCLLLAKFFRLQVLEHERWERRAEAQHFFLVKEPFRRGTFFENTSLKKGEQPLAFSIEVPLYHLYADPKSIPEEQKKEIRENILRLLCPQIKEATKMAGELRKKSRSRRLISWLSEEQKALFSSWWFPYAKKYHLPSNALFFVADFKRFHPMGHLLGQVIHTIQEKRDEATGKALPTGGLELSLNSYLEGAVGWRRLMRSPHNSLETGEVLVAPIHGADVELTISPVIQAILEEELEKGVKLNQAKGGIAIMVEPKTGHVLALAQYPFFFPDTYQDYFNTPELAEHSKMKAIIDTVEPGSPMKAFTVACAFKANRERKENNLIPVVDPLEKIATSCGSFPGRSKRISDVHKHSFLNLYMGVQHSSNIYMATIAGRVSRIMGDEWYRHQLSLFGFGEKTGIELVGECPGLLPHPGKLNAHKKLEWSKATPYSLAMGYNIQVTGAQMVRGYSAIANKGVLPTLTLVRKITRVDENGESQILVDHTGEEWSQNFPRVLDQDDALELVRALKFVTKPGGTATRADINGYTEAGKTGTTMKLVGGRYSEHAHFASFVGFAPAMNPAFVLYVGLDEPLVGYIPGRGTNHQGGTCAAPIFREVGRRTLEFLGVPMDDPFGFPPQDPRSDQKKADWYKENLALTKLCEQWNR
jgi:cell division protein FtsI (penicillin-binding protein 3)